MSPLPKPVSIWIAIALFVPSGCGPKNTSNTTHGGAEATIAGARVVTLRRPTAGLLHLSVWLDAGSRDIDPPQIATVAAWLAAERAGDGARGQALPDGIVVELLCERDALRACAERLGRALSSREVSDRELEPLRERLVAARRRAASDEGRTADALALRALLGDDGARLVPLGEPDDDDDVRAGAVSEFLADHFGPTRALVVGAGDVRPDELAEALEPVFDELPPAIATRRAPSLDAAAPRSLVAIGESHHVTVALVTPTLEAAKAVAVRLDRSGTLSRLSPEQTPELGVNAFAVRGGAIVLARASGAEPVSTTHALVAALAQAVAEAQPLPADLRPDSPELAARTVGYEWLARDDGRAEPRSAPPIAVGAVAAGGRGDDVAEEPDADLAERLLRQVEEARRRAMATARPELRGPRSAERADVRTDNGARIVIQRRPSDQRVAVVLRFAGGADLDPAPLHGRVAMLARLAHDECEAPAGIDVATWVETGAWGVTAVAVADRYGDAIEAAIRCGAIRTVEPRAVEAARVETLAELDDDDLAASWAGQLLAPQSPGTVAPRGDPEQVRHVTVESMRRLSREVRVGHRVSVAVVGDVPVEDAALRVARRVSPWPGGEAVAPSQPGDPPDDMTARRWSGDVPRVVIGWRTSGGRASDAEGFAAAMAHALAARPGLTLVDARGGAAAWGTWAYVVVDASEETLSRLPIEVREATAGARQREATQATAAERRHRLEQADPAVAARRALDPPAEDGRSDLSATRPRFLIARPDEG